MPDHPVRAEDGVADEIVNDLVSRLRATRQELRISRVRLAAGLEVSEFAVVSWETGRDIPIVVNFFRWAHELGYVVDIREASSDVRVADSDSSLGMRGAEYSLLWIVRALRKVRMETALSQRALSARLGVSLWTIGQWESAQRTPRLPHLVQWCGVLNRRLVLARG